MIIALCMAFQCLGCASVTMIQIALIPFRKIPIFQYDLGIRQGETLPCEGCEDMLPWCVRCTVMPQALE